MIGYMKRAATVDGNCESRICDGLRVFQLSLGECLRKETVRKLFTASFRLILIALVLNLLRVLHRFILLII